MSTSNPIQIQITRDGSHLSVPSTPLDVQQADPVEWLLPQLGTGELAFVQFQSPASEPFGPFQTMVHLNSSTSNPSILAFGNTGHTGPFSYKVLVLNENEEVASSHTAIINNSSHPDSSPEATIRVVGSTISVEPRHLRVLPGQTALWYVQGLQEDQIITFDFDFGNPMIGPFSSFSVSRGFDTARVAFGINFLDPRPASLTVDYLVQLRNLEGTVLDSDDPTIEPLGPPPNTGGG